MQRIKKLVFFALNYGILAWMAAIVVWFVIVNSLRNGVSCDEGYYLMGYLRGQNVEGQATDFHSIVRAICSPFADNNIMVFRYVRLVLNVLALMVFALSSFRWLSCKKNLPISRWAYYPFVALAGAMSFTFAAPTISYDSIELILALLIATLLFVQLASERKWIRHLSGFGIGFLLWFAFANYPPAGVCLAVLFAGVYFLESDGKKWKDVLFAIIGFGVAMVVHHLFVHDLRMWFSDMSKVFVSTFTEKSKSRHDSGSLVSAMLLTIGKLLLIFVPTVAGLTLLMKKVVLPKWLQWIMTMGICVVLLVVRNVYHLYGTLLLFPVAFVLAKVLSKPESKTVEMLFSKGMLVVLIIVAIPLAGVFGTNQIVMRKALVFTPFWLVAYSILSTKLETKEVVGLNLVFIVMLFAGYVYLGNFQRYHYYYTPRSSKYELIGVSRPQEVLVSKYQQEYYRDVMDSLRQAGCKAGDLYMAFGENQMTVYLAGGYIDGRLPYHWWQYKDFEKAPPKAFILFKNEEADVLKYFKQTAWGFPEDYHRIEMQKMSENMGENLKTVIYVK